MDVRCAWSSLVASVGIVGVVCLFNVGRIVQELQDYPLMLPLVAAWAVAGTAVCFYSMFRKEDHAPQTKA
jgi:hypothetical protein